MSRWPDIISYPTPGKRHNSAGLLSAVKKISAHQAGQNKRELSAAMPEKYAFDLLGCEPQGMPQRNWEKVIFISTGSSVPRLLVELC